MVILDVPLSKTVLGSEQKEFPTQQRTGPIYTGFRRTQKECSLHVRKNFGPKKLHMNNKTYMGPMKDAHMSSAH